MQAPLCAAASPHDDSRAQLLRGSDEGDQDTPQTMQQQQQQQQPGRPRPLLVGLGAAALGVAVIAAVHAAATGRGPATAAPAFLSLEEAPKVCGTLGGGCTESGCCVDGGEKGLQCYVKGKNYAECYNLGNCTAGVHAGEKDGSWDATGTFQLDKWSCEEKGQTSKPACWSYGEDKCPNKRCMWLSAGDDKCATKCSILTDAGGCWGAGNCMWNGDHCEDGCWMTDDKEQCSKLERCMWLPGAGGGNESEGSCGLACHVHGGPDDCPHEDKCVWDGATCIKDPCSAPGEDCTKTQCCSVGRGALGMVCIEKMKYWATCMTDFNKTAQPHWSGKRLGIRPYQSGTPGEVDHEVPKFELGCNWAGLSCSETKYCCNEGYTCAKKDEDFVGCVLTMKKTTWIAQNVPLPEGWDGEKVGGWRSEYQVQPQEEGKDMAGTSLYCLMAVVPDSAEMGLLDVARQNNASIFGCNASSVYAAWFTNSAGWDTAETTVVNTAVFLKVFEWVKSDKLYLNYDWTIKADADCVFLPERLRGHLWALRPPPDTAIYLKNNHLEGLGNSGFLGAIEVFSKKAMMMFMDNAADCGKFLGTNSGEDGFFKGCMDAMGVGFMWDMNMFKPNYDPATCLNGMYAAYHPIKFPSHWQRCWDLATGKMCPGITYDCGGELDPPVNSLAPR